MNARGLAWLGARVAMMAGAAGTYALADTVLDSPPFDETIAAVRIEPRLASSDALPLQPGDTLTTEKLSAALRAVKSQVAAKAERLGELTGAPYFTFAEASAEFRRSDNGAITAVLRPHYIALPLGSSGRFVLPSRLGLPSGQPRLLPISVGLSNDRALGLSFEAGAQIGINRPTRGIDRLSVSAEAQHSLEHAFRADQIAISAARTRLSGTVRNLYATVEGSTSLQPAGENRLRTEIAGLRAGATFAPFFRSQLLVDVAARAARERFLAGPASEQDSPQQYSMRLLFEKVPAQLGLIRATVWHDTDVSDLTTRRLIGRLGFSREWMVRPNQTIGIEIIGGAGRLWGDVPERRRFYGGTAPGHFLGDAADAPALIVPPNGPLIRSFGRAQAGLPGAGDTLRGGTRFSHLNLNLTLPIPAWSRPLIPRTPLDLNDPAGRPLTLQDMLRSQVDRAGPNMLASSLVQFDGLERAEAERQAAAVFSEIQPAAHYLINRANVFSIKPLLLFDVATLDSGSLRESWTAAGVGVQLNLATAKLEAAAMRTLSGPSKDRTNLIARFAFERLF